MYCSGNSLVAMRSGHLAQRLGHPTVTASVDRIMLRVHLADVSMALKPGQFQSLHFACVFKMLKSIRSFYHLAGKSNIPHRG